MSVSRVFSALQIVLHLLVVALLALATTRATELDDPRRWLALGLCAAVAGIYVAGLVAGRRSPRAAPLWLTALVAVWAILVVHVADAAFLAFPFFFLCLLALPVRAGTVAVAVVCAIAVVAIGLHLGWTTGGVVGPVVAALAAVAIGVGYRALVAESARRAELIGELTRTRSELAERERVAGRDAERARLAGEIHDTVAQGLSSIQMLLRAVERDHPDHPAANSIALARTTAGESLTDTRRVIAELRPAALEGTTFGGSLHRLARDTMERELTATGRRPLITVDDAELTAEIPIPTASALLRIAQESVANAVRHGSPSAIAIRARSTEATWHLEVTDDGSGFDADAPTHPSSFGLAGMRDRAAGLGGRLHVTTAPSAGTTVGVEVPR